MLCWYILFSYIHTDIHKSTLLQKTQTRIKRLHQTINKTNWCKTNMYFKRHFRIAYHFLKVNTKCQENKNKKNNETQWINQYLHKYIETPILFFSCNYELQSTNIPTLTSSSQLQSNAGEQQYIPKYRIFVINLKTSQTVVFNRNSLQGKNVVWLFLKKWHFSSGIYLNINVSI